MTALARVCFLICSSFCAGRQARCSVSKSGSKCSDRLCHQAREHRPEPQDTQGQPRRERTEKPQSDGADGGQEGTQMPDAPGDRRLARPGGLTRPGHPSRSRDTLLCRRAQEMLPGSLAAAGPGPRRAPDIVTAHLHSPKAGAITPLSTGKDMKSRKRKELVQVHRAPGGSYHDAGMTARGASIPRTPWWPSWTRPNSSAWGTPAVWLLIQNRVLSRGAS